MPDAEVRTVTVEVCPGVEMTFTFNGAGEVLTLSWKSPDSPILLSLVSQMCEAAGMMATAVLSGFLASEASR